MPKKFWIAVAVALLSIAGVAHSASPCGLVSPQIQSTIASSAPWYCPINQEIYAQWAYYEPAAIIAVLIAFSIAGLIYMVGIAANSNRIRNFGVGEFYEAIASAMIVVLFMFLCAVLFGLIPLSYVGSINPYATSFRLISSTISSAQQMYASIFRVYLSASFITSANVEIRLGGAVGAVAQTAAATIPNFAINSLSIPITLFFMDPAAAIAGILTDGITALYAEYYLLVFFSFAAIPVFLIPGTILRAIFPTRAFGGILIGLAFGFYLVMPLLFSVAFYFTAPSLLASMSTANLQFNGISSQSAVSPANPFVQQLSSVKSSLNGFWLLIFFYPSLIISITYAVVRQISEFAGRAVSMGARMRSFI